MRGVQCLASTWEGQKIKTDYKEDQEVALTVLQVVDTDNAAINEVGARTTYLNNISKNFLSSFQRNIAGRILFPTTWKRMDKGRNILFPLIQKRYVQ